MLEAVVFGVVAVAWWLMGRAVRAERRTVIVKFSADTAGFEEGLRRAAKSLARMAQVRERALKDFEDAVRRGDLTMPGSPEFKARHPRDESTGQFR